MDIFSLASPLLVGGGRKVEAMANKEGHRIVGNVIGREATKLEGQASTRLKSEARRVLPKFAEGKAEELIDTGVHKARVRGEALARKEASKIRL